MPTYSYIARSRSGERAEGTMDAPDRRALMLGLERKGLVPVSVKEAGLGAAAKPGKGDKPGKAAKPGKADASAKAKKADKPGRKGEQGMPSISFSRKKTHMTMREVSQFTRELADLLNSGMTLGNALNTLSRRKTKTAGDAIVSDLRDQIIKGKSLSDALAAYPASFSNLFVSMVRAGEASGAVPEALARLSTHFDRVLAAREKVVTAMTYPMIVLSFGFITIIFVMTFVIPKFSLVFLELGATLPLPTRILIGSSSFVLKYGIFMFAAAVAATSESGRRPSWCSICFFVSSPITHWKSRTISG